MGSITQGLTAYGQGIAEAKEKKRKVQSAMKLGEALSDEVLEAIGETNPGAASFLGSIRGGLISGDVLPGDLGVILGEVSPMPKPDEALEELQKAQAEFLRSQLPIGSEEGTIAPSTPKPVPLGGPLADLLPGEPIMPPTTMAGPAPTTALPQAPQYVPETMTLGPGGISTAFKRQETPQERVNRIALEIDEKVTTLEATETAKSRISREQLAENLGETLNSMKDLIGALPQNVDIGVVNRLIGWTSSVAGSLGIDENMSDYKDFALALAGQLARVFTGETGARLSDQEQKRVQNILLGLPGKGPKARAARLKRIDDILEGRGGSRYLQGQIYDFDEAGEPYLLVGARETTGLSEASLSVLNRLQGKLGGR